MRRRALALVAALALAVPAPGYAADSTLTDPCGETTDQALDVTRAELHYSDKSVQVRVRNCDDADTNGDWYVTFHLTSFTPEVQITAAMTDVGRTSTWSGFYLCQQASCPVDTVSYPHVPSGTRMAGSDWFDDWDDPAMSGREAYAYGAWSWLIGNQAVPSTIDYYVTLHQASADLDRAPNTGTATSTMLAVTRASAVVPAPVTTLTYASGGVYPVVRGLLHYDSSTGPRLPNRLVTLFTPTTIERVAEQYYGGVDYDAGAICPGCGEFATAAHVTRNTSFVPNFEGDGFTDFAASPPTVKALVRALVTLNRPSSSTMGRGTSVSFTGVVRPAQPGTNVVVQARSGGAGQPWRTWRTLALHGTDTAYSTTWTPTTAGTTTFRVVWLSGSTADGDVVNGISNYTTITVN
jgi:hypothetical protein